MRSVYPDEERSEFKKSAAGRKNYAEQELEEIPELLDTRVMDGSIDTFCFGEKRITGLQLSRHEAELDESPAVFKKPDVRFYVNAVLDIYDEIVDVGIEYGINLRIR